MWLLLVTLGLTEVPPGPALPSYMAATQLPVNYLALQANFLSAQWAVPHWRSVRGQRLFSIPLGLRVYRMTGATVEHLSHTSGVWAAAMLVDTPSSLLHNSHSYLGAAGGGSTCS